MFGRSLSIRTRAVYTSLRLWTASAAEAYSTHRGDVICFGLLFFEAISLSAARAYKSGDPLQTTKRHVYGQCWSIFHCVIRRSQKCVWLLLLKNQAAVLTVKNLKKKKNQSMSMLSLSHLTINAILENSRKQFCCLSWTAYKKATYASTVSGTYTASLVGIKMDDVWIKLEIVATLNKNKSTVAMFHISEALSAVLRVHKIQ